MNFKLPIEYVNNIMVDKDIIKNIDFDTLYKKTFSPETIHGNNQLERWYSTYTYNTNYLKDTQKLFTNPDNLTINHSVVNTFTKLYDELKNTQHFLTRYKYIDFKYLTFLNQDSNAMQLLSLYNFASPVINLITPIVILIIPFFILKSQNIRITFDVYKDFLLKNVLSKYNFNNILNSSLRNKGYIIITTVFYFLSIYHNIISTIKFYKNNKYIHNFFNHSSMFFNYISEQQTILIKKINNLKHYRKFKDSIVEHQKQINKLSVSLSAISKFNFGKKMIEFHKFKFDKDYIALCEFSLQCLGYIDIVKNIANNTNINKCKFSNKTVLKDFYTPLIENDTIIKNSTDLNKNYIISGPNASGKTTYIKSILSNLILSQQIGQGYYKKASIKPYHRFHCYLNIPDTNNRDSLFQAEARLCKSIIDDIKQHSKLNHFIVFDELYSGTNPDQAVKSAYSYLKYLGKFDNTSYLLTTHFYSLCSKFNSSDGVVNISMKSQIGEDSKHKYFYKVQKGISTIKSGFEVLSDMDYPEEIINTLKTI